MIAHCIKFYSNQLLTQKILCADSMLLATDIPLTSGLWSPHCQQRLNLFLSVNPRSCQLSLSVTAARVDWDITEMILGQMPQAGNLLSQTRRRSTPERSWSYASKQIHESACTPSAGVLKGTNRVSLSATAGRHNNTRDTRTPNCDKTCSGGPRAVARLRERAGSA